MVVKALFISYFIMVEDKMKLLFKSRRTNKIRSSSEKIYVSRPELKHTNNKITIMLYIYNKQKLSIELFLTKQLILCKNFKNILDEKLGEKAINYKNKLLPALKKKVFSF
jgi:hypothetical protein